VSRELLFVLVLCFCSTVSVGAPGVSGLSAARPAIRLNVSSFQPQRQLAPKPGFYGALALGMSGLFWLLVRRDAKREG
jgi:hypothetical protein